MASKDGNGSHLSTGGAEKGGAIRQHKRLAMGEKVTGETNPNGEKPDMSRKVRENY
jgi:hypothetical protein